MKATENTRILYFTDEASNLLPIVLSPDCTAIGVHDALTTDEKTRHPDAKCCITLQVKQYVTEDQAEVFKRFGLDARFTAGSVAEEIRLRPEFWAKLAKESANEQR